MKASADGTFSCELNNATHRRYDDEFVDRLGYLYLGTEVSSSCCFFFFRFIFSELSFDAVYYNVQGRAARTQF